MPGRLRTNFRSGNLAEHLGLLLLKSIAAVADVPRSEDIGLDAIATLLRPDADGNCYAEDSFVVQLKSDSQKSIDYRGHQLEWFLNQSHPMFIGFVSRKESCISLYSTLHVNQAVLALHSDEITMVCRNAEGPYPWEGGPGSSATVSLGQPLLRWSLADMENDSWSISAYEILKRFLGIARREHQLLSFGQCSTLSWSTNDKESIRSSPLGMMKGHPNDFRTLADACMPGLKALLLQAVMAPDERRNSLATSLLAVAASLRDLGVDIDPPITMLANWFLLTRGQPASDTDGENVT